MARARHRSRCGLCQYTIHEGEIIVQVDGEWVHRDCALDSDEEFYDDETREVEDD